MTKQTLTRDEADQLIEKYLHRYNCGEGLTPSLLEAQYAIKGLKAFLIDIFENSLDVNQVITILQKLTK